MRKLCFLLSILGHGLLLLVILYARFPITIRPGPPRQVVVRIAEPPLPTVPEGVLEAAPPDQASWPGAEKAAGPGRGAQARSSSSRGSEPFAAAGAFRLRSSVPGSFRLAPVGRAPEPWALPLDAGAPFRPLSSLPGTYRPGAAAGGGGGAGSVFLLPFDVREKAVAAWTNTVLARIERNWVIPPSGRLAFSGRVQVTLTIGRSGRQQALAVDDAGVPEALAMAALHAVQASLPLPPLPENVAGEAFEFTFVFAYNG